MPSPRLLEAVPRSAAELEDYLLNQRTSALAALGLPQEFVLPCYGLSIANLPATLAAALRGELTGAAPPLPERLWADLATDVRRVVWITLNAAGWPILGQMVAEQDLLYGRLAREGRLFPITSIFPTSTSSALITLWTGQPPAQHGLVGHTMYLRELGLVADMLLLSRARERRRDELLRLGLSLEGILPVPGLAEILAGQGIVTRALMNLELARTSFSRLSFRGVAQVSCFVTVTDMCVGLRELLAAHRDERLLLAAYLAEIDIIGHVHGADSESIRAELRALSWLLQREFLDLLSPEERRGTLFVLSADHGQLTRAARSVHLPDHPGLWDHLLIPPTGSLRAAYLYARQGRLGEVRRYLQERLSEQFAAVDSGEALRAGLLGPGQPTPTVASRLGDLILIGRQNYLLENRKTRRQRLGMHAGLSADEVLVPVLMARLD